jgi:hypothetical protein
MSSRKYTAFLKPMYGNGSRTKDGRLFGASTTSKAFCELKMVCCEEIEGRDGQGELSLRNFCVYVIKAIFPSYSLFGKEIAL